MFKINVIKSVVKASVIVADKVPQLTKQGIAASREMAVKAKANVIEQYQQGVKEARGK